jgi:hypothetical protein
VRLVAWAKRFDTTPLEVRLWFPSFGPDDTIGGAAPPITVRPDDAVTISDHDVGTSTTSIADPAKRDAGIEVADRQRVDIGFHSDADSLGSTSTDSSGHFEATVRIPLAAEGAHFIVALAPRTQGGKAAFVYPVQVRAADGAAAGASSADRSGAAKRFPWLRLEALLGTISVILLFVYRVRSATAGSS